MANIIPCNEIEDRIDELKLLFVPCYKLKSEDIDLLSDLVYSASLCSNSSSSGSGDITNQNNIFKSLKRSSSDLSDQDPSVFINNLPLFSVEDIEILDIINEYVIITNNTFLELKTDYYFLKLGKGSYGIGGTQVTKDDFLLYKNDVNGSVPLFQSNNPQIEFLIGDIDDPAGIANLESSYTVVNGQDLFFIVSTPQIGTLPQSKKIYRFIGIAGTYGLNETLFTNADFILVEDLSLDDNGNVINNNDLINIIELEVGANINLTGNITNIAEAINASFGAVITTQNNTIHRFIATKEVRLSNGNIRLDTVVYDWKGNKNIINEASSVESDYSLIETIFGIELSITNETFSDPQLISYSVSDLDDPATQFNLLDEDVIVNDNDLYVKVYLGNLTLSSFNESQEFKIYRFLGGNGTYGLNNTQVTNADFLEIDQTDNNEPILSSGLEAIDEGNGIGYRLIGKDPLNFLNIGLSSIDLGFSTGPNLAGTPGSGSLNTGGNNILRGNNSFVIGVLHDIADTADNSITSGYQNIVAGYASNTLGVNITNTGTSGLGYSFATGRNIQDTSAYGASIGTSLIKKTPGTIVLGKANLDYISNGDLNALTNPALIIGNGTLTNDANQNALVRSDGFVLLNNGLATLPSVTNTLIDTDPKAVVTKEYLDANAGSASTLEGYSETGTRANSNLVVTIGDYDNLGTGTQFVINDVSNKFTMNRGLEITSNSGVVVGSAANGARMRLSSNSATVGFAQTTAGSDITAASSSFAGGFATAGGNITASNTGFAFGVATNDPDPDLIASGQGSVSIGRGTKATAISASAFGYLNNSTATAAYSMGGFSTASGDYSGVLGRGLISKSTDELSVGYANTDYTPTGTKTDRIFSVGNGDNFNARSNAFTIYKNGAAVLHPVTLASITNAQAGMMIIDSSDSNQLKFYDGTAWRTVSFT